MPELHDMLTQAVPPVDPGFDEADVRVRAAAAERRQRRVAIGSMLAVVVVIGVLVVPALLQPNGVRPIGEGELVPLSQWPTSFEFAGVEVGVFVSDAPDEAIQGRVALGMGEAGLNTEPDGPDDEPGVDGYRARTWFSCGTGQVVHVIENGRAPDAPSFEIPGPRGRWLPPGALLEAASQLTEEMGCTPQAPAGTPREERGGQPWLGPFAAAIDEAGLATCCFNGYTPPRDAEATHAGHVSDWGVLLSGDDRLSLSVGEPDTIQWDDTAAELVPVGQGVAANQAISDSPADVLWFVCDGVSVLAYPTSGEAASVGRFVDRIGCAPQIHPSFTRSLALSELLRDVGGVVVATTPDPVIGISRVRLDGVVLEVRSGQMSQVGMSPDTVIELNRGWQALDPAVDGYGAIVQCGVTHAIKADDPAGADVALALAEQIVRHPDCSLDSGFEIPTTSPDPDPPAETTDETQPLSSFPPEVQAEILSNRFEERLREAGFDVDRQDATSMHIVPPTMPDTELGLDVAPGSTGLIEPPGGPATAEVALAGGQALLDEVGSNLFFRCDEGLLWLSHVREAGDGPGPLQAFLDAAHLLSEALECTPAAPATTPAHAETSEAEAFVATLEAARLAITSPHVGPGEVTFGFQPTDAGARSWMVSVRGDGGWPVDGDTELVLLDDGGEVAHLGSGVVIFWCAGVAVRMAGDTETVQIGPIAELTAAAGCDARPPGPGQTVTADDGTQVERAFTIREARLEQAITAMGLEPCCGEPSHGGTGAATGMVWEGTEVFIFAGPPMTGHPDYQAGDVIEFAGGQADLGDGDGLPLIAFDCGDTNYQLSHDSTNTDVQIRAAEALLGQLGCTPRVGPAD